MSEEYWKEKTEYWRTLLDQKDARIAELEKALRGMEAMYTHVWDRVDGSLVCMPESVDRFEAAHHEARKALGL